MYLTAQRIEPLTDGKGGINAFHHRHSHPLRSRELSKVPNDDPGIVVNQHISVKPGGNRVRSFLDVVAPEATPWERIRSCFLRFVSQNRAEPMPWEGAVGECWFRLNMDAAIAEQWESELADLYLEVESVRT